MLVESATVINNTPICFSNEFLFFLVLIQFKNKIPNEIKNVVDNENLIVDTTSKNIKLMAYKYILGIPSLNSTKKKAK